MVLMREGGTENGKNAITGGLHNVAAISLHRLHHDLQRGVDDVAGLLGVEMLDQLHRALDVCEQRRDCFAFPSGLSMAVVSAT
jgi:hypothetical protein